MSMKWAIPKVDIREGMRRKQEYKNKAKDEPEEELKTCPVCLAVFHEADYLYRRLYKKSQISYEHGVLPTTGLKREKCKECLDADS